VCVRRAATARCITLGGEGDALYPVFSSYNFAVAHELDECKGGDSSVQQWKEATRLQALQTEWDGTILARRHMLN